MCTRYGKSRRPQHCRCPEARGESLTVWESMAPIILQGKCRCLQHCVCQGGCRVLFLQAYGYGPWYCGLICAPCLAFSICSLVLSERASPVGWSQSVLIVPVREEQ